jgi:hypothetical protein
LTQQGIERIESLGVDHVIVERYKRVGNWLLVNTGSQNKKEAVS